MSLKGIIWGSLMRGLKIQDKKLYAVCVYCMCINRGGKELEEEGGAGEDVVGRIGEEIGEQVGVGGEERRGWDGI